MPSGANETPFHVGAYESLFFLSFSAFFLLPYTSLCTFVFELHVHVRCLVVPLLPGCTQSIS